MALLANSLWSLLAYVGPAGIGAMGVLVVVALVLLIGVVGLVLHPLRLALRFFKRRQSPLNPPDVTGTGESTDD